MWACPGSPYGALPDPAAREGCRFDGWWVAVGSNVLMPVTSNTVVWLPEDHVLKAKWSGVSGRFTLDTRVTAWLDAQGGTVATNRVWACPGSPYGALPDPAAREGCRFDGWWVAVGSNVLMPVTSNTVVWLPEDHVLKAKWSGVSGRFTLDTREMRVTFVSDWGEVSPASKDVTVGEAYGALPEFDEREH